MSERVPSWAISREDVARVRDRLRERVEQDHGLAKRTATGSYSEGLFTGSAQAEDYAACLLDGLLGDHHTRPAEGSP